ncbi:glycosyltransferase family 2 protein [Flavobacterium sp. EDS]|uniref:glycosyltransferase family A protein n=1 Tax=Flavobacterium sp. EDS TaxID=2897328 RepID=UPI001E48D83E|nr:glycosyltransferase family A protein [Flavobacterium sp. EDS]MCD0473288.1 glycosyltransferase family 2 protein [Flavobacterium sp. EDS]
MIKTFLENDIEILISTMNQDSLDFLVAMFPFIHFSNFSILIINQTQNEKILTSSYSKVRVINSFEKGLAKSRNLALDNAIGKILVIADDDIVYQGGFTAKVMNAYNKFPQAAVINFSVINSNRDLIKKYPSGSKVNLNIFDILNVSSIEMTLNKAIVDASNIRFDERFGLGGTFEMGEEAVFLSDLKAIHQQLIFDSQIIVMHESQTSSEKKNITNKYYIQGALFSRIFKNKYIFWIFIKLFFDLKQKKIRLKNIKTALKSAKRGHEKFDMTKYGNK